MPADEANNARCIVSTRLGELQIRLEQMLVSPLPDVADGGIFRNMRIRLPLHGKCQVLVRHCDQLMKSYRRQPS